MSLDPIFMSPLYFLIKEYVSSLYGRIYNIEIFCTNNILILIYFSFHYYSFILTINKHKADIIYKKYKGSLLLHIICNYCISILLCDWLINCIYYDNDILWNILFAPFIAVTLSTSFDSRILRKLEKKIYSDLRRQEFASYRDSLKKLIEAQELQQKILNIHNRELANLRNNINIMDEMVHLEDKDKKQNKVQDRDNLS